MKPGIDYIGLTVVFCCYDGKGKFLLQQRGVKCRDEQGFWEFGGGQIEFGETVEAAVLREMREEIGVSGSVIEALPPLSLLREDKGIKKHWLLFPFIILVDPKDVVVNEPPEKIAAVDWFRWEDFPQPLHPGDVLLLEKYKWYFEKLVKNNI